MAERVATSPGRPPVQLRACFEELLKLVLESAVEGILDFDLGLSKEYCSSLLKIDPNDDRNFPPDCSGGVPSYPLYKGLASALHEFIVSGSLCGMRQKLLICKDSLQKEKEEAWKKVLLEKGSKLINILNTVDFELHVQDTFLFQLKDGLKTVEGRCAVGDYVRIGVGTSILFNKCLMLEVQDVRRYASFSDMLEAEDLAKVLPGVKTIEEGVQIYRKFYTEEKERSTGVVAICVVKLAAQPYASLGSILSEMSYGGIQSLLGFSHTVGTVSEALPPPKSTLLSSFMLLFNFKPHAKGGLLTSGARALAKHVHRSDDEYRGHFRGSDSDKNRHAMNVINHLIAHCCWLNLHLVPPHGVVFEIRIAKGYGARWSHDGTKFVGFLEPYMEDGHAKRWKH